MENTFFTCLPIAFMIGIGLVIVLLIIEMIRLPKATPHVCSKCGSNKYQSHDCGYMGSDTAYVCECGNIDYA